MKAPQGTGGQVPPAELGDAVASLARFARGDGPDPQGSLTPEQLVEIVERISDAAAARRAIHGRRPVTVKQLAALAEVTPARVRQLGLERTADGDIQPDAARQWLQARGVTQFTYREYDLTPTWWQSIPRDHPLRSRATTLMDEGLPTGVMWTPGDNSAWLRFVIPPHSTMSEEQALALQLRLRQQLEALLP